MTMSKPIRKIVKIDEAKCNGCGDCVPSCAEGAIRIINGKARLMAENLCDGLGACLGHCPMGAITVEERAADDFDHHAVEKHLKNPSAAKPVAAAPAPLPAPAPAPAFAPMPHAGGCPGSRMRVFEPAAPQSANLRSEISDRKASPSRLRQWPVQLTLLPTQGPIWTDADVLLAADCVPFAYPDFHENLLAGRTLAIACPKLDDCQPYIDKLTTIFASNSIRSVTVARMEVPCCSGLTRVARMALEASGRTDLEVKEIVLPIRG